MGRGYQACEGAVAVIHFDEATHVYMLDDRLVPSVTQCLSVINNLYDNVSPELLERARMFGVHCHRMVDLFNRGELDEERLDPELVRYLATYKQFLFDSKFEMVESECKVASKVLGYAGTFDGKGRRQKLKTVAQTWLIDLKSGAVPRTVGPQTAAYRAAHPEPPRRRAYLQLARDRYVFKELADVSDMTIFQSALNCFRWRNPRFEQQGNFNGYEEATHA